MSKKNPVFTFFVGGIIFAAILFFAFKFGQRGSSTEQAGYTAKFENEKQIIEILAKNGYSPRLVNAKKGVNTVLRVKTESTYDCTASLVIPDLQFEKILNPTDLENIEIPAQKAQGTLRGLCGMGMFQFKINFL